METGRQKALNGISNSLEFITSISDRIEQIGNDCSVVASELNTALTELKAEQDKITEMESKLEGLKSILNPKEKENAKDND